MDNNQNSFFEPKTIVAILLMAGIWMGWQWYMQKKYPNLYTKKAAVQSTEQKGTENQEGEKSAERKAETTEHQGQPSLLPSVGQTQTPKEMKIPFESPYFSFEVSNRGMGITNIRLKKFKERDMSIKKMGAQGGILPFETTLNKTKKPLYFDLKQTSEKEFIGSATFGSQQIIKKIEIVPENYSIKTQIRVIGESSEISDITTFLSEKKEAAASTSFLMPQFEKQDFYVSYDGTNDRIVVTEEEGSKEEVFKKASFASLSSQYFSMSLINESDTYPSASFVEDNSSKSLLSTINYPILNRAQETRFNYISFLGPKSYDLLASVSPGLEDTVDYGMFSFIAKYVLKLLKVFHSWFNNWGWAIVLLTIVVRMLILPLAVTSYKSMKRMQEIQPQLKLIRENFKDDPQKMNQEVMKVMKESKANPLSGCLPMLLQFPIFLALYQVIGQSVELYQAPFMLWLQDLSLKDPYYILPVSMSAVMVLQQKLTPTTMDPTQAKMMMAMPVLFCFFMLGLPSGLTLYFVVSSFFAIFQQLYFMRDTSKKVSVPALQKN